MKKIFALALFVGGMTVTSALTCTDLPKNLAKGAETKDVLSLQNFLFDKGLLKAKPNGYFGEGTIKAVKEYQKTLKLSAFELPGGVGAGTRDAIKNESCLQKNMDTKLDKKPTTLGTSNNEIVSVKEKKNSTISESRIVEIDDEYKYFSNIIEINGIFTFQALDSQKKPVIVSNGKVIGKDYDLVSDLTKIGNSFAYLATKKNGKKIVVYNEMEVGEKCRSVYNLISVNNKLTYLCGVGVDYPKIIFGDSEFRNDEHNLQPTYSNSVILDLNGKLVYKSYVKSKSETEFPKMIIASDGVALSKMYYSIGKMMSIGGKLAYSATEENNGVLKNINIYDGKEYGKDYQSVGGPYDINGKLAFVAKINDKITAVVYNGKEYGKEYSEVSYPFWQEGKFGFSALKNGRNIVVYDGKEIDGSKKILEIGTKFSRNYRNWGWYVSYNGKEIGGPYDEDMQLMRVDEKLFYLANKNKKTYIITEK